MKPLRAILFAFLTYVITLAIGIIIGLIVGFETLDMANPPMWLWVASAIVAVIVTGFMAHLYFRSPKVSKGALSGLYLGMYMLVVGVCLDLIAWIPQYMQTNTRAGLWEYYQEPTFAITLVLILIVCILTGRRASRQ